MFYFLKVKVGDIMDEVKEFLVLEEEEEVRLDIYLAEQLGDMSRSYIQKIIKDGKVKMTEASCPDHVCIRQGTIDAPGNRGLK